MAPRRAIETEAADGRQLTLGEVRQWLAACYELPDDTLVGARIAVSFTARPPCRILSVEDRR